MKPISPVVFPVAKAKAHLQNTVAQQQPIPKDVLFTGKPPEKDPAKESKQGVLGSIGTFIQNAFNLLMVKPFRWLREKLAGLVGKPAQKEKATNGPEDMSEIQPAASHYPEKVSGKDRTLMTDTTPLFGTDLKRISFEQKEGNTCYLLASLDSILKHPQGKKILDKIQFYRTSDGYSVQFPGQDHPIEVSDKELKSGKGVRCDQMGIRLIESAYLKIPGVKKGEYDQPTRALERIFGWKSSQSESISMQNNPKAKQFIGGVEFSFAERKQKLQEYLEGLNFETFRSASDQNDVDILAAIQNGGAHYYSIRLNQPDPNLISLADPFNTKKSIQLPIDEFLAQYHIEGVRLPIKETLTITQH